MNSYKIIFIIITLITIMLIIDEAKTNENENENENCDNLQKTIIFIDTDGIDLDSFDSSQVSARSDVLPFNSNIFNQDNIQHNYGIGW